MNIVEIRITDIYIYIHVSCFLDVSPSQLLRKWPEIQRLIESQGGSLPPLASHNHGQGLGVGEALDHPAVLAV